LVISGSQDANVQAVVASLNRLLGAYGSTIDTAAHSNMKAGDDTAMANFVQEVQQGRVGAVLFYNVNPVYNYPAANFGQNLQKVGLKISFSDRMDETASVCDYVCPDHNYLEAWGDAEPRRGYFSIIQPTINPIFKTRSAQESMLTWAGAPVANYYAYLQNYWRTNLFPQAGAGAGAFEAFWTRTLHDGVFEPTAKVVQQTPVSDATASNNPRPLTVAPAGPEGAGAGTGATPAVDLNAAAAAIAGAPKANANAVELCLYEKIGMGSGDQANNPYLQEFPDPISRACWDNYLTIPKQMAVAMELVQGDMVQVAANGKQPIVIPVLIQPGQAEGTVGLAVGYGRTKAGKVADNVGKNAFPLASYANGTMQYVVPAVNITKAEGHREIAQVQTHHTIMARPIVQEANLADYQKNQAAGRFEPKIATPEGPKSPTEITLWKGHQYVNHSWGMIIDLNSCTGCGACVVACNVENNIPVVGRQEVLNRREMHWLRIDRYYSSAANPEDKSITGYKNMEEPSANPEVIFQPMLCQHCQNAPCETVCPVIATAHSSEGLNMMAYNRCIGTRYCANNCPYKVRRFNWFKYHNNEKFDFHTNNDLGKMVLNPDVTVRSRGVMEKCTFCVQRIQEGKLNAKKERRRPKDGEIVTACAQSCATGAITFGDLNDPESRVAQIWEEEDETRGFRVLEEINTRPQITYLTKIRNKA
jgi:molybdopterin-containing oxidoreductase family iron-sulfur binding subunit